MQRLKDKVAVVTGGAKGIGRAIAAAYGREGAKVIIADVDEATAARTADSITAGCGQAVAVRCDITRQADIDNLFDQTLRQFGRVDVAVNNAGISGFSSFLDMERDMVERICSVNYYGTFFCAQKAARIMAEQRGGVIINMSSISAQTGQARLSAYAPTKGAVSILTKCMAVELAEYNIRVHAVGCGTVITDINRDEVSEEQLKDYNAKTPLGVGRPEDLAGIYIFLATNEASYMTGHTVYVDGGYNIL